MKSESETLCYVGDMENKHFFTLSSMSKSVLRSEVSVSQILLENGYAYPFT